MIRSFTLAMASPGSADASRLARLGLVSAAASLAATVAGCAGVQPLAMHRVTTAEHPVKLDFFTALNADCSFIDYSTIRVLEPPAHGKIVMDKGTDFTSYGSANQRYECNRHRSPGTIANYTSEAGYAGEDRVRLEVIYTSAETKVYDFFIKVGATSKEQGGAERHVARTVVSGSEQKLDFNYSINPDCTSLGELKARVIKTPDHGKLRFETGDDYTKFPKENSRYECNRQKTAGLIVYFVSDPGFTGPDTALIEVTYPQQLIQSTRYDISVK